MTRAVAFVLFSLLPPTGALAQGADSVRVQGGALWVDADRAAAVLVDDVVVGAPGAWIRVATGPHRVAIVDDLDAWDPLRTEQAVDVGAGDSLRLALELPRRLRVETLPIRAQVVFEDAGGGLDTLGTSPLTVELPAGATGALIATREGYLSSRMPVDDGARDPVMILLTPAPGAEPEIELLPTERSTRSRTLVDVGIGAATAAAAAVAIHFKFRADAIDDDYRGEDPALRADEALREEALRLDRYSAIALGVMQVGVGVLAIRFVLR